MLLLDEAWHHLQGDGQHALPDSFSGQATSALACAVERVCKQK